MENQRVKQAARSAGIPYWKIGEKLGVCEQTIVRWLRVPLTSEKERKIMEAIDEIRKEAE